MGTNRFYTPSLPQFTSQFVEEKMPFEEMLATQDFKAKRTDTANVMAGEIDAMTQSLLPGGQTVETSDRVSERYRNMLQNYQEKYKGQEASMPALKALTQIKGAWSADPEVKDIMRDREETQQYMQMWHNKDQRDFDPNRDVEGNIMQLEEGQRYSGYNRILPFDKHHLAIQQAFDQVTPDTGYDVRFEYETDEKGIEHQVMINEQWESRTRDRLSSTRDELVDQIMSGELEGSKWIEQHLGEDFTLEGVTEYVDDYRERFSFDKRYKGSGSVVVPRGLEQPSVQQMMMMKGQNLAQCIQFQVNVIVLHTVLVMVLEMVLWMGLVLLIESEALELRLSRD